MYGVRTGCPVYNPYTGYGMNHLRYCVYLPDLALHPRLAGMYHNFGRVTLDVLRTEQGLG